jgi:hypothetical protein
VLGMVTHVHVIELCTCIYVNGGMQSNCEGFVDDIQQRASACCGTNRPADMGRSREGLE